MIYLVATPGRTGSKMLIQMLANYGKIPGGICNAITNLRSIDNEKYLKYKNNINLVLHTHDTEFINNHKLNPDEIILIVSKRYNEFESLMSLCIGHQTKEWQFYSNQNIEPFVVDTDQFLKIKHFYKNWYKEIYKNNCNKVFDIYYEDIVNYGETFVAKLLEIENYNLVKKELTPKSPYCYQDLILNWEDLLRLYYKD